MLIVGGGPAGAAVAVLLARAGREVVLLEKSAAAHHKVCGEFLSGEALDYLAGLGVDLPALGAVPIRRVRLAARSLIAETDLPFPASSLTRRSLDEALLVAAESAGAQVERGATVESLVREDGGWRAVLPGGDSRKAGDLFAAAGKYDLRGRPRPSGAQSDLIAFKMYYGLSPQQQSQLSDAVEITLIPQGYAGLQIVEGGMANLCLLVSRDQLRRCEGRWSVLLESILQHSEHLAHRLSGAEPLLSRPLALSSIPYGFVRSRTEPGLWWLGDQAAVIPSFSGDGMSIALHSAHLAARCSLRGESSLHYQEMLDTQTRRQVWLATALSKMLVKAPAFAQAARPFPWLVQAAARATRIRTPLHD